ncbi:ABC transporter permease [Vibrio sp. 10N.222.51.E8]|uniref:ABC transporter permease n=1 Tax=unclassified Vibrio TaxID=2614977 RepID=UPI0010BD6558|nr:ABC transporter permease [Vibrio sp. F13]TKG26979.1 ABC transporter [Vibrio sp. F13]
MSKINKRSPFIIWKDVIFALFLREIRSKFNDKLGLGWAILQPVSFILILSIMRGRLDGGETHSMPTFIFIIYGMVNILFFNSTLNSVSNSIKKNKALFAFRQVKPISSVMSLALLELLMQIFIFILVYIVVYILRIEMRIDDPILMMFCMFQIWLIAVSLGIFFGIVKQFIPEIDKIRTLAMKPLIFISGVFFSLQDIPKNAWVYFDWNPLLHAIELSRQATYSSFGAIGVSHIYLSFSTLTIFTFSMCVYVALWKKSISV